MLRLSEICDRGRRNLGPEIETEGEVRRRNFKSKKRLGRRSQNLVRNAKRGRAGAMGTGRNETGAEIVHHSSRRCPRYHPLFVQSQKRARSICRLR